MDIVVYTTRGSEGNFPYTSDIQVSLTSDKYGYDNFMCLIRPIGDSEYGIDKKTIDELKVLIPREAVSRKVITKNKDIENYFNNLDSYKLYFFKKRHNQSEHLYYSYILMMDSSNNIIPTNTLSVILDRKDFDMIYENRYILSPGKMIKYIPEGCKILHDITTDEELELEKDNFIYSSPFTMVINTDPILSLSYYSTNVNNKYNLNYKYINLDSNIQFICNNISINRHYLENNDNYICDIDILQNITKNFELVTIDPDTNKIKDTKIKVLMVLSDSNSKYYVEAELVEYDATNYIYKFRFTLNNDNMINSSNNIRINKVYQLRTTTPTYSYFERGVNAEIYVYVDSDNYAGNNGIDLFPNIVDGYTLTNIFNTKNTMELFVNYSETINSVVKDIKNQDGSISYKITGVPMVKYSYINNIKRNKEFLSKLSLKKSYIDDTLKIVENPFSIDLKFFNTYGVSKLFNVGYDDKRLDRVNLSLKFRVKLIPGADDDTIIYIKDEIKGYIENINKVDSIHMNNLCVDIKNKFNSNIEFIEFVSMNNYDATYQYLEKVDVKDIVDVPEFVNVNSLDSITPDIVIISV